MTGNAARVASEPITRSKPRLPSESAHSETKFWLEVLVRAQVGDGVAGVLRELETRHGATAPQDTHDAAAAVARQVDVGSGVAGVIVPGDGDESRSTRGAAYALPSLLRRLLANGRW